MFRFRHAFEVQFRDLDLLGHVNNVTYLAYIEHARLKYVQALGVWNPEQPSMVLARSEIDYLKPVFLGQSLEVAVRTNRVGRKSIGFEFELFADGILVAKASCVNVWFDFALNQSVEVPAWVKAAFLNHEGFEASEG